MHLIDYWPILLSVLLGGGMVASNWQSIQEWLPKIGTPTGGSAVSRHTLLDHYDGLYAECPDQLKPDLEKVGAAILMHRQRKEVTREETV